MIIRARSDNPYAMVPKAMLQDDKLSLAARGLMALLYSREGDVFVRDPKVADEDITSLLAELESAAYLQRSRYPDEQDKDILFVCDPVREYDE